jgi:dihydropteroate synthase
MPGFSVYDPLAYADVVSEVASEWRAVAALALGQGLQSDRLIFDPGLGFTKNAAQSLELCARLAELRALGHPILVGTSRKSYVGHAVAAELGGPVPAPKDRLGGSLAAALLCAAAGASILRVHDVAVTRQALAYAAAVGSLPGAAASADGEDDARLVPGGRD